MKQQQFTLQIFDVPDSISESDLKVEHERIESWELTNVAKEQGNNVANITLHMRESTAIECLFGNISVSSSIHEVHGTDLDLAKLQL